ncbi:VWA domain-containing protein [Candidatus Uabimicrobium sp. HlEnr_7]|uniref:VWA domain-containing protein n=1 Tax=Candidatus Uabimicrobium helgolandensis TaxID=3095367 RepID=UPI0035592AB7
MFRRTKIMGNFILLICLMGIFLYVTHLFLPNMVWNSPWFFLLLILLPILIMKWSFPRKSTAIKFSSIRNLKNIRPSWRVRAYFFLPLLKACGFFLIVVALARPQIGNDNTKVTSEGIAILMTVDVSGSMRALDFSTQSKQQNRLDVIKEVFRDFVMGNNNDMDGRKNDLIGIVAFGGYPESKCPLTLDHNALVGVLEKQVEIPKPIYDKNNQIVNQDEFSTAIGDAIAIAVERLKNSSLKSKVLVLLTDGENTAGVSDPLESAQVARDEGIKIYTIGVGTNGKVPFPVKNAFGENIVRLMHIPIDEQTLQEIAKVTGGKYFNARRRDQLRNIYKEIDTLEKQEIKVTYLQYEELYLWFLIAGILIILLEKLLVNTILRKVP